MAETRGTTTHPATKAEFFSEPANDVSELERREKAAPLHPFRTKGYIVTMQESGYEPWILGLRSGSEEDWAAAFLKRGRLNRMLEIPSLPAAAGSAEFWEGVRVFCRKHGVTNLVLTSYASPAFELPPLNGEVSREVQYEHTISLEQDPSIGFCSSHKRNIKKARNRGAVLRRSRKHAACVDHARLMLQSRDRRANRGEDINVSAAADDFYPYLKNGAGELFQVEHGGAIVSSVLVLRSAEAGYSHTAGTSPEGMAIGASFFLVQGICEELKRENVKLFNMGGAEEGSSLTYYKEGFGCSRSPVVLASCEIGPVWRRKVTTAIRMLRSDRGQLLKAITGHSWNTFVYARDMNSAITAPILHNVRFEPLSEADLAAIPVHASDPDFGERQASNLRAFGRSYAFGVYWDDVLAHVSWLLPPEALVGESPRMLLLKPGEAEISACETLPEFRGKGLYPFAIQKILEVAQASGIQRVYMKTVEENKSSQAGIIKAGMRRVGTIRMWTPPFMPSRVVALRSINAGRLNPVDAVGQRGAISSRGEK